MSISNEDLMIRLEKNRNNIREKMRECEEHLSCFTWNTLLLFENIIEQLAKKEDAIDVNDISDIKEVKRLNE